MARKSQPSRMKWMGVGGAGAVVALLALVLSLGDFLGGGGLGWGGEGDGDKDGEDEAEEKPEERTPPPPHVFQARMDRIYHGDDPLDFDEFLERAKKLKESHVSVEIHCDRETLSAGFYDDLDRALREASIPVVKIDE